MIIKHYFVIASIIIETIVSFLQPRGNLLRPKSQKINFLIIQNFTLLITSQIRYKIFQSGSRVYWKLKRFKKLNRVATLTAGIQSHVCTRAWTPSRVLIRQFGNQGVNLLALV